MNDPETAMRLYTPAHMRALFERDGLVVEQAHRSLVFDAYGKSAPRMEAGHVGQPDSPANGSQPFRSESNANVSGD